MDLGIGHCPNKHLRSMYAVVICSPLCEPEGSLLYTTYKKPMYYMPTIDLDTTKLHGKNGKVFCSNCFVDECHQFGCIDSENCQCAFSHESSTYLA